MKTPIQTIIAIVARRAGLPVSEMFSTSLKFEIRWPRQLAMKLARDEGWTLSDIAPAFKKRSEKSIKAEIGRVETLLAAKNPFACVRYKAAKAEVEALRRKEAA